MGSSKTFRAPPSWQGKNTPRGSETYSKGSKSTAEGSTMSGGKSLRQGAKGRNKSKAVSGPKLGGGKGGYS